MDPEHAYQVDVYGPGGHLNEGAVALALNETNRLLALLVDALYALEGHR